MPSLNNCRVVLVRPEVGGNIGSVARAMRNFGLQYLVLVSPKVDSNHPEARRFSMHGEAILDAARIVPNIGEAVADCVLVVGTSARTGGLFRDQSVGPPDVVMSRINEFLPHGPAALVFGPEPSGLTNEEVSRCHQLIHIPATPEYPALNLAQAVTVCLYELRCQWLKSTKSSSQQSPASFTKQEEMFEHLRRGLEAIHFLYGEKADSLMHAMRHMIGRAGPTDMELGVLHGLARQMEWISGRSAYAE
jgi:tRNA/rRNA methyltransferase